MDAAAIQNVLPWRPPFLLIDRMIDYSAERHIRTEKRVTLADATVDDGGAWLPGFLLLEGMSQSAALLFRLSRERAAAAALPVLGYLQASMHGSAAPGDAVTFEVSSVKMTDRGGVFEGRALKDGVVLAEAELAFAATPVEKDAEDVEENKG